MAYLYTAVQKYSSVQNMYNIFFFSNKLILLGHIKLIKSGSKDIYNVIKDLHFK